MRAFTRMRGERRARAFVARGEEDGDAIDVFMRYVKSRTRHRLSGKATSPVRHGAAGATEERCSLTGIAAHSLQLPEWAC